MGQDRFGIGWRPQLAAGILANLDRLDIVEVIADDYLVAQTSQRRALTTLARQVPVALHGVTMGMASAVPVEAHRLRQTRKLFDQVQPKFWSEHLAFVRAGGIEIGHLAAPPRTPETVDGAVRNLAAATRIVGQTPLVENIATLIDPPGSSMSEMEWTRKILDAADCPLLLDLHNLYANSVNFAFDPYAYIDAMPAERIRAVHIAGGRWIRSPAATQQRLLDDHRHAVPEPVFALLQHTGRKTLQPLTIILERDGRYPPIEALLAELDRARQAVAAGRSAQALESAAA